MLCVTYLTIQPQTLQLPGSPAIYQSLRFLFGQGAFRQPSSIHSQEHGTSLGTAVCADAIYHSAKSNVHLAVQQTAFPTNKTWQISTFHSQMEVSHCPKPDLRSHVAVHISGNIARCPFWGGIRDCDKSFLKHVHGKRITRIHFTEGREKFFIGFCLLTIRTNKTVWKLHGRRDIYIFSILCDVRTFTRLQFRLLLISILKH